MSPLSHTTQKVMVAVIPTVLGVMLALQGWAIGEIFRSKYTHLTKADEYRIMQQVVNDRQDDLNGIEQELEKIAARLDILADTQVQILIAIETVKKEG